MVEQKISPSEADRIRERYEKAGRPKGMKVALSKEYKVSTTIIGRILAGSSHQPGRRRDLPAEDVVIIRQMAALNLWTFIEIGEQFNITGKHVGDIVARRTRKDVP